MSSGIKKSKGAITPFDPSNLIGQLRDLVGKESSKGKKSWVSTLLIVAAALAASGVWYWVSWRRSRELAKLRHEKMKRGILLDKSRTDRAVASNDGKAKALDKVIAARTRRFKIILADIRAEESRYEADLRAINRIRSWRDAGIR